MMSVFTIIPASSLARESIRAFTVIIFPQLCHLKTNVRFMCALYCSFQYTLMVYLFYMSYLWGSWYIVILHLKIAISVRGLIFSIRNFLLILVLSKHQKRCFHITRKLCLLNGQIPKHWLFDNHRHDILKMWI